MKTAVAELEIAESEDEEEDVPTAMAQAFQRAMRRDDVSDEREIQRQAALRDHRQKQEEILARTLRNSQS